MMIIIVNVRKTKESEMSIQLRILTNYMQIVTTTMSFSTKYPTTFTDMLVPVQTIGDSSESFVSMDCFISDYEMKGPFPSSAFMKLFLTMFLPFILFLMVSLIWVIMYWIKKEWIKDFQRYLVITFISILFLLHPKLAQESINIFR